MNKREVVWLLVRIAGVCLLVNTCRYCFMVLENVLLASKVNQSERLLSESSGLIAGWVIEAVVSFIAGLYLIGNGRMLYQLLNYEPERESEINETS